MLKIKISNKYIKILKSYFIYSISYFTLRAFTSDNIFTAICGATSVQLLPIDLGRHLSIVNNWHDLAAFAVNHVSLHLLPLRVVKVALDLPPFLGVFCGVDNEAFV